MDERSLSVALGSRPFRYYETVGSTNTAAKEWLTSGDPPESGAVVAAEEQTEGKGRHGRRWVTPCGAAVAMSVVLEAAQPGVVSAAAALAVKDAISPLVDAEVGIKWPNDIELDGRKCAGILVESVGGSGLDYYIVGIGINVSVDFVDAADLRDRATSICAFRDCGRLPVDRAKLIAEVADNLSVYWRSSGVTDRWRAELTTLGTGVRVSVGTTVVEGRAIDVDPDGRLLVKDVNGVVHRLSAGDVTRAESRI